MVKIYDPFVPDINNCVGRDKIIEEVIASALNHRCVLLFGGRQIGKTTLLLKIVDKMKKKVTADQLNTFICPVFVDLTRLKIDATPADFFDLLIKSAFDVCSALIEGFAADSSAIKGASTVEEFVDYIQHLTRSAGNVDLTFLFLIDESERVLGERFPRGFQDNLFSVLYGPELAQKAKLGVVFAGSQVLYKFSEDETSPIGSRAAYVYLSNILKPDVKIFFTNLKDIFGITIPDELHQDIFVLTGGHAGLMARLCNLIRNENVTKTEDLQVLLPKFIASCRQLFRLWASSLSINAREVHDALGQSGKLSRIELVALFNSLGLDPLATERATEEMTFSGIATWDGDNLVCTNQIYWNYIKNFLSTPSVAADHTEHHSTPAPAHDEAWSLIEKAEISLRSYISSVYVTRYGDKMEKKLSEALGASAMSKILMNVAKSNQRYKYTARERLLGIFDGLYLGQLGQLMTWKDAWPAFSHLAQDKREIELLLAPINAVRTDKAHFYQVPIRELTRCKLHCEDLIGLIEKYLPKGAV